MFVDPTLMVTIDLDNHQHRNLVVLGEETIKTVLKSAGLTEKEAVIYIFLAKHEPLKGTEIAKLSKKDKAHVFRILKKLQAKGFVEATLEFPARYTVVSFETILESVVKAKREEVNFIEKAKKDLIEQLRKKSQIDQSLEKFVVVKGKKRIHAKIYKMFQNTKSQISVAMTASSLMQFDRYGVFDAFMKRRVNPKTKHRFLTELSEENLNSMKALLKKMPKTEINFKARNLDLGAGLFPRMVTRDNEEILFFTSTPSMGKGKDEVCLWTNSKSLVQAFNSVFEDLWRNSTDLQDTIIEMETGKPAPKTCVINNAEEAKKRYEEILQCAQNEIVLMTSSKNLSEYLKNSLRLEQWIKKDVSVRIMAPIVSENLKTATEISKICEVKHIPLGYPEATIVDSKHYFQFKTPPREELSTAPNFENTFYSNDFDYVHKMKNMFDDVWKNASVPNSVTLEAILKRSRVPRGASISDRKRSYLKDFDGLSFKEWKLRETPAEKDVLNRLISAKKFTSEIPQRNTLRLHGSMGSAIVHPPHFFNLPDMVFTIFHVEKHSSLGEEDFMLISVQRETPNGHVYVPSTYVGDNPKAQDIKKAFGAGTPAGQNVQLFEKDEIQIQIHGNTLFAAWARQIPLIPKQHVLPPSCLLMEGYGDLQTDSFTMFSASGYRTEIERNGFAAFVTFFHPASKYSGPGTDGFFARDYVATIYKPSINGESQ